MDGCSGFVVPSPSQSIPFSSKPLNLSPSLKMAGIPKPAQKLSHLADVVVDACCRDPASTIRWNGKSVRERVTRRGAVVRRGEAALLQFEQWKESQKHTIRSHSRRCFQFRNRGRCDYDQV